MFARFLILLMLLSPAAESVGKLYVEMPKSQRLNIRIPSVAPLIQRVKPASLFIKTRTQGRDRSMPPGHPEFERRGQGSGFLIHPSGYALTNFHVIENAYEILVQVGDGSEEIPAKLVGVDKKTDVALIKLPERGKPWPVMPLGFSKNARVGDFVVAIGNPFGLAQSISLGVISARSRKNISPNGSVGIYDFLQTDAAINFGNSGGPLLNLSGEVVGMNTAINAAAQGIGFAIPIDMIKEMLPALKKDGRILRSYIGVNIQEVTSEMLSSFQVKKPYGALVSKSEGPAKRAGVRVGDIILKFNGIVIKDHNELMVHAGNAGIGKKVNVQLLRKGEKKTVPLTLEEHPENLPPLAKWLPDAPKKDRKVGLQVSPLGSQTKHRLSLPANVQGLHIKKVRRGSAAAAAGLHVDDVILKVDYKNVSDASRFVSLIKNAKPGQIMLLYIMRGASPLFVSLKKP